MTSPPGIGQEKDNDKPKKTISKEKFSSSEAKVITKDNNAQKRIQIEQDGYNDKHTVRGNSGGNNGKSKTKTKSSSNTNYVNEVKQIETKNPKKRNGKAKKKTIRTTMMKMVLR